MGKNLTPVEAARTEEKDFYWRLLSAVEIVTDAANELDSSLGDFFADLDESGF